MHFFVLMHVIIIISHVQFCCIAIPATEGYIPAVVAVVGGVIGTILLIIFTTTFILLIGLYWRHKTRSQGL